MKISAQSGELLIIPFDRVTGILIAKGKGIEDWNFSAPHGAGRVLGRRAAKEILSEEEYKSCMKEVVANGVNEKTLDESPMAYKGLEEIMKQLDGIVEVIDMTTPVLNYKDA